MDNEIQFTEDQDRYWRKWWYGEEMKNTTQEQCGKMKQSQIDFGRELLEEIAKNWRVDVEAVARILDTNDQYYFFQWANAREFLEGELWRKTTPSTHAASPR